MAPPHALATWRSAPHCLLCLLSLCSVLVLPEASHHISIYQNLPAPPPAPARHEACPAAPNVFPSFTKSLRFLSAGPRNHVSYSSLPLGFIHISPDGPGTEATPSTVFPWGASRKPMGLAAQVFDRNIWVCKVTCFTFSSAWFLV